MLLTTTDDKVKKKHFWELKIVSEQLKLFARRVVKKVSLEP